MGRRFSILTSRESAKVVLAVEKLKNDGLKRAVDWDYEEYKGNVRWIFFSANHAHHYGHLFMNAIGFESVQKL